MRYISAIRHHFLLGILKIPVRFKPRAFGPAPRQRVRVERVASPQQRPGTDNQVILNAERVPTLFGTSTAPTHRGRRPQHGGLIFLGPFNHGLRVHSPHYARRRLWRRSVPWGASGSHQRLSPTADATGFDKNYRASSGPGRQGRRCPDLVFTARPNLSFRVARHGLSGVAHRRHSATISRRSFVGIEFYWPKVGLQVYPTETPVPVASKLSFEISAGPSRRGCFVGGVSSGPAWF